MVKQFRFVYEKFVKTYCELDLFWEPDATEGGVTVTAGEPRVLPACIKKKKKWENLEKINVAMSRKS